MEQNVSFLTAFNNQIDNFLDDLRIVCPNEKEFGMLKNGISIVKKTNPRIILNQFNEIIIPYKEQLLLRNDSFFIVRDFQDDFTTVSSDYISKVTNKLKELNHKIILRIIKFLRTNLFYIKNIFYLIYIYIY